MKTLGVFGFFISLIFSFSVFAENASPACEALKQRMSTDSSIQMDKVIAVYDCNTSSGESSCLVQYEENPAPYPVRNTFAYLNPTKNVYVGFMAKFAADHHGGQGSAGHYICSYIVDYVDVYPGAGTEASVSVSRETARDAMFCPGHKKFFEYNSKCVQL